MSIESRDFTPSSERGEEELNKELINRARELSMEIQKMLERHGGEYPETLQLTEEDEDVHHDLEQFFDTDCSEIPSFELGPGGEYGTHKLKRLSDSVWLLKEVFPIADDFDNKVYSIIDKEEVIEVIQNDIEQRKSHIEALEAQNQKVEQLLSELK